MAKELYVQSGDVRDADRICDDCGRTVSPNDKFCPHCGERIHSQSETDTDD